MILNDFYKVCAKILDITYCAPGYVNDLLANFNRKRKSYS